MIRQDPVKFSDGNTKTHVRVVKSFRPGPGMTPRQVTVKSFGYLEDQTNLNVFWAEVKAFDEAQRKQTKQKQILISIPVERRNHDEQNRKYNYGYRYLESIYEQLGIQSFFDHIDFKGEYRLADVFEFLTLQRILNPGSKRRTAQTVRSFYNKEYSFELADIYRAMDKFSEHTIGLQKQLNEKIQKMIGRDQSYAFYDVTNYYFETDYPGAKGDYQQKGVSKEHQLSPIVQLGLFMDSNQLPIAMSIFPGNTADSVTLQPVMKEVKANYQLGRLIVVADKGLNSQSNIDYIVNEGDGYVVSQVLRGPKGKRYLEMVLDPKGYVGDETSKYKVWEEEYESKTTSKKKIKRKRKVLIYWSQEESDYAKRKRAEKIQRAEKQLRNNAYGVSHRADEYVSIQNIIKATGEISDQAVQRLDYEKIDEEEQLDGYFCIITSELEYTPQKMMEVYHGLWRIEESFRITKSDLQTRPIYVRTQKHLEAHFLICYTALLIARLFQYLMGEKALSVQRIKTALNACTCVCPDGNAVLLDEIGGQVAFKEITTGKNDVIETLAYDFEKDQIAQDYLAIQEAFQVDFDYAASTREYFNKFLKSIKFKPKKKKI